MEVINNLKSLKSLNKYLFRYRKSLLIGALFVVISNFFAVIPAQLFRKGLDLIAKQIDDMSKHQSMDIKEFDKLIFTYAGLIILMALLRGIFMFFMRQTLIVMSRKVEYDLKNDIYKKFQELSLTYYRRNNTGDLMAKISEDVSRVRMYIGPAIMYLINLSTLIILIVTLMLSVNVKLTFFALLPLPFLALGIYFVNNITYKRSTFLQEKLSDITTFAQETFSGIRVLKSFSAENETYQKFETEADEYMKRSMSVIRIESLFTPLIALLVGFSVLITLYVGGKEVIKGNMTAGNIAEFFFYVNALTWPVASLGWTTNLIQRAAASQKRINDILDEYRDIDDSKYLANTIESINTIEFDKVTFKYQNTGIIALKSVSFKIEKGQSVGFIGATGSGKSTITQMILRNFDVTSGQVLINNEAINKLSLESLRSKIGYVPQDDFLFSDSIKNNTLFRSDDKVSSSAMEEMYKSAEIADILKDIQGFTKAFETEIGERGITLSGGQKQRVAIARGLINNPELLIFDDCFSAIDTNTESIILHNVFNYLVGKTAVIVSHRVSTVKNCDTIYVLEDGQITEFGSHAQLLEKKGYYYNLYSKQLAQAELDELVKS